jgi:acyl carrier protein
MTEINLIYNKGDSVMTREEKLEVIADILEVEEVEEDNVLEDFETWDSIAVLSVISVITEETGLFPHANEIKKFKTVSDIMKAIGD